MDLRSQAIVVLVVAVAILAAALVLRTKPEKDGRWQEDTKVAKPPQKSNKTRSRKKAKKSQKSMTAKGESAHASGVDSVSLLQLKTEPCHTLTEASFPELSPPVASEAPRNPLKSHDSLVANGIITQDDFEDAQEGEQSTINTLHLVEDEQWQSVRGKGTAPSTSRADLCEYTPLDYRLPVTHLIPPTLSTGANAARDSLQPLLLAGNSGARGHSIASANPFDVLPSGNGSSFKQSSSSRSISLSSSKQSIRKTMLAKPPSKSASASAEQTKRQRQNAARQAAAKEAKAAEERARIAKLEAHRRKAQMERVRDEGTKKARASVSRRQTKAGGAGNGNRGGLDAKASVNDRGQLVWD